LERLKVVLLVLMTALMMDLMMALTRGDLLAALLA
jgi:hypothetical protein